MPGMGKLYTDFVRIGRSGKSIDGRDIDPQWLRDAAETYDPEEYTALIWPDHLRFGNNYGKVLELKAEEEGGVVTLLARLQPNASYAWDNQYGQRLFFSMELAPNFAGTGKTYLVGLGVTDSPASLGTDELKFSARRNKPDSIFMPGEAFSLPEQEEAPTWFTRFMEKFKINPKVENEEAMDKAQFEAMTGKIDALATDVSALKAKVEAFAAKPKEGEGKPAEDLKAPEAAKADDSAARFAALDDGMKKLGDQLGEIAKRFEAAANGTKAPATTAPADEVDSGIL